MADDWQIGDLALCVDDKRRPARVNTPWRVKRGAIYTVTRVIFDSYGACLDLAEDPVPLAICGAAWDADRFRKISPLTEQERDEFLADLKAPEPVS